MCRNVLLQKVQKSSLHYTAKEKMMMRCILSAASCKTGHTIIGRLRVVRGTCCLSTLGLSSVPLAVLSSEHPRSPAQVHAAFSGVDRSIEDIGKLWETPAVIVDYRGDTSVWAFRAITTAHSDVANFMHLLAFGDFQLSPHSLPKETWLTFVNKANADLPIGSLSYFESDDGQQSLLGLQYRFLLENEQCEPSRLRNNFLKFDESVHYLGERMKSLVRSSQIKSPEFSGGLGV